MYTEKFRYQGYDFTYLNYERNNPEIALDPLCEVKSDHPKFKSIFGTNSKEFPCFNDMLDWARIVDSDFADGVRSAANAEYHAMAVL
jgi:hypothetical protein